MLLGHFKYCLVNFLIILLCHNASSQNEYKAIVIDNFANEPIANVNILVVSSTEGYFSNKKGYFSIPNEVATGADIIFSHVNYEASSKYIPIDYAGIDTIYLTPISHEIENVTITSRKNNLKKRRLLLFRKDLFDFVSGKKDKYKEVDFLNPEDLLFQISDNALTAKTTKLLEFRNNYLGYDMRCFMQEYKRKSTTLNFSGKASFKDIAVSKRKAKKYSKRREKLWEVSQQNFLRSIIFNNLDKDKYSCKALVFNQIDKGYQTITDFSEIVFPTKLKNIYAIISPSPITIRVGNNLSHIIPKNGLILVNKKGVILNKEETQLRGYWEEISLTKTLPSDYKPISKERSPFDSKVKKSISELRLWAKEIQNQTNQNRTLDEIIVETDRFIYNSSERVQVCAHLFNHKSRLYIDDCLVKIELVNQSNEILASKTKMTKRGICHTSFQLSDTLPHGQYGIRAYTGFMRNFSDNLFGKATIAIDLLKANDYTNGNDSIYITFKPEGGKLLYDLENRVVASIVDKYDKPVLFDGRIIDNSTGEEVILNTILPGLAVVNLHPSTNSSYGILSDLEINIASNIKGLLPISGSNLQVFCRNKNKFRITKTTNNDDTSGPIRILDRGRVVHEIGPLSANTFSVSKDFLPNEILTVQLFDEDNRLLSERMIDNTIDVESFITFKNQFQFFYTNQPCEIDIVPDSLLDYSLDSLDWNVRIVQKEYNQNENSYSHLTISPTRLEGFNQLSTTNKVYIKNLELIGNSVLSEYKSAYEKDIDEINGAEDFSLSITGFVNNPDPPYKGVVGKASITSMSSVPYYDEVSTDDNGAFLFENVPYGPNLNFVVQARKNIQEEAAILDGDRYVDIVLEEDSIKQVKSKTSFHFRKDLIPNDSIIAYREEVKERMSQNIKLDEVVIKDRVSNAVSSGQVKDLETMDWVPKNYQGQNLLKIIYPNRVIRRGINDPSQLEIQVNSRRDGFVYQTLNIFINGTLEFGPAYFESLTADRIKYLSLSGSVLNIVTTPGSKSRTENMGITNYILPETIDDTDISSINDPTPRQFPNFDNRKTLYWNPAFFLSKNNTGKVIFRSSAIAGEYEIIASAVHPQLGYISFSKSFEVVDDEN